VINNFDKQASNISIDLCLFILSEATFIY